MLIRTGLNSGVGICVGALGMSDLLTLRADGWRCYEEIGDILTFSALTLGGANILFVGISRARFSCLAGNIELIGHLTGFDETLRTGKLPHIITFERSEKMPPPEGGDVPGLKSVNSRITAAIFAVFAARANDWVKLNYSTAYDKWPPVSNFARIVRNAISHGGTVNLNSDKSVGGSWRGVEISYHDNGRQLINAGQLSIGDLVLLMLELDAELNDLGAPLRI